MVKTKTLFAFLMGVSTFSFTGNSYAMEKMKCKEIVSDKRVFYENVMGYFESYADYNDYTREILDYNHNNNPNDGFVFVVGVDDPNYEKINSYLNNREIYCTVRNKKLNLRFLNIRLENEPLFNFDDFNYKPVTYTTSMLKETIIGPFCKRYYSDSWKSFFCLE